MRIVLAIKWARIYVFKGAKHHFLIVRVDSMNADDTSWCKAKLKLNIQITIEM